MRKLSEYIDYDPLDEDTAPMEAVRKPSVQDVTLHLPAVPALTITVQGCDAATLDALAFESRVLPETLIVRWIREKAYARQLESESRR
jgi:hypothetical protein